MLMKKIATLASATLVGLMMTVTAAPSYAYDTETHTGCNDRVMYGPIVTANSHSDARKRARNQVRIEALSKLSLGGKISNRNRRMVESGGVTLVAKDAPDGKFAYRGILKLTICRNN